MSKEQKVNLPFFFCFRSRNDKPQQKKLPFTQCNWVLAAHSSTCSYWQFFFFFMEYLYVLIISILYFSHLASYISLRRLRSQQFLIVEDWYTVLSQNSQTVVQLFLILAIIINCIDNLWILFHLSHIFCWQFPFFKKISFEGNFEQRRLFAPSSPFFLWPK